MRVLSGRPGRARLPVRIEIGTGKAGELALLRAGVWRDHVDVVVEVAVGIGAALGDVGDQLTVGRPRGKLLVVRAGRQCRGLAAGDVVQVQVRAAATEPAAGVVLELDSGR